MQLLLPWSPRRSVLIALPSPPLSYAPDRLPIAPLDTGDAVGLVHVVFLVHRMLRVVTLVSACLCPCLYLERHGLDIASDAGAVSLHMCARVCVCVSLD